MINRKISFDGVYVNEVYGMAIQNATQTVRSSLIIEDRLLEGESKNDFKKAFKKVAKLINECKKLENLDKDHAAEFKDLRSRLTVVYAQLEKILNDEFKVDTKNIKNTHDVQNSDESVIKPYVEQIYRKAVKTIPNEIQDQLCVCNDILVSYNDEPNNWIKACTLVDHQIKLANTLYEKTNNRTYLFIARRLYALQCVMTNTVRSTLDIDIQIDEDGKVLKVNKQEMLV